MKKIISMVLCMVMILSFISVKAEENSHRKNFEIVKIPLPDSIENRDQAKNAFAAFTARFRSSQGMCAQLLSQVMVPALFFSSVTSSARLTLCITMQDRGSHLHGGGEYPVSDSVLQGRRVSFFPQFNPAAAIHGRSPCRLPQIREARAWKRRKSVHKEWCQLRQQDG